MLSAKYRDTYPCQIFQRELKQKLCLACPARKQARTTDEDVSEENDAFICLSYNPRRKQCNVMAIGNNDAEYYHLVKFCNDWSSFGAFGQFL